jgi:hypothetical protein
MSATALACASGRTVVVVVAPSPVGPVDGGGTGSPPRVVDTPMLPGRDVVGGSVVAAMSPGPLVVVVMTPMGGDEVVVEVVGVVEVVEVVEVVDVVVEVVVEVVVVVDVVVGGVVTVSFAVACSSQLDRLRLRQAITVWPPGWSDRGMLKRSLNPSSPSGLMNSEATGVESTTSMWISTVPGWKPSTVAVIASPASPLDGSSSKVGEPCAPATAGRCRRAGRASTSSLRRMPPA